MWLYTMIIHQWIEYEIDYQNYSGSYPDQAIPHTNNRSVTCA